MTFQKLATAGTVLAYLEKPELAFLEAMESVFGRLNFVPVADGVIRRFHVPGDRPGSINGWAVLFGDGIASGRFSSWKQGTSQTWSSRKPADPLEAHLIRQRLEQAKRQREAAELQRWKATAIYASRLWNAAQPASPDHPYLLAKQVAPHGLRQCGTELLVPLYANSKLVNLQRIQIDCGKRFLKGGRIKDCYSAIGHLAPGQPLLICEGWATGATLYEQTGHPVACAMNAGNLKQVVLLLHRRYPDLELIVCGDDDRQTAANHLGKNPGRIAANEAALAIGAQVAFPEFPDDAPLELSDFNDLVRWKRVQEGA